MHPLVHYRGEDLPDGSFFEHAVVDKFKIPAEQVAEFVQVFMSSPRSAQLLEQRGKYRILDVTSTPDRDTETSLKKTSAAKIVAGDSCFVVMPFGAPSRWAHQPGPMASTSIRSTSTWCCATLER
jgi:hypothetical protein